MEGHLSMRYLRDEFATGQSGGGPTSHQLQHDLREELFLMTHSYVYHPNFLTLDLGGGPIYQRGRFATELAETASDAWLYNLSTRATFLREKPYRGSAFYEHSNPTLNVSQGEALTQESTQYGFDVSLLAPATPVPMHLDATRTQNQGRGSQRVIDDQIDRVNFRAARSFGASGYTQAHYYRTHQESRSGSPNLPIQGSTTDTEGLGLDSRFRLGARAEYDLVNLVSLDSQKFQLEQGPLPDRTDRRFLLDVRGRHSDKLHSFANYNYISSEQGVLFSTANAARGGLNYWPDPNLALSLALRAEDTRASEFDVRAYGGDGTVMYERAVPLGIVRLGYGLNLGWRDQEASSPLASVIGERITLSGTNIVPLSRLRVTAGSVVVSNLNRTQTFVEGADYALSVVGLQTRIQRLVGGAILDPEDVLVDYTFDPGGTFAYRQADHRASVNWLPVRFVDIYARYFNSDPKLTSGTPSSPLNSVESTVYGTRADVPLATRADMRLGGGFEHEHRQETIAPSRRRAYDLYARMEEPFLGRGYMQLSSRRTLVDYELSDQDVDLTGYDFRLWSRHPLGIDLSAEASYEVDTGTAVVRKRTAGLLKAQWRYRQLLLSLDLQRTREIQGAAERTRTLGMLMLRRDLGPW